MNPNFKMSTLVGIFLISVTSLVVSSPIEPQIVGGDLAILTQFPYQAALLQATALRPVTCGGSIIGPFYILTAAHCVYEQNPEEYVVRVGQVHLKNNLTEVYEQEIRPYRFIIHPEYSPSRFLNDIALIELAREINLDGEYVATTGLPVELQEEVAPGSECVVTGWGANQEGDGATRDLNFAHVPSMSDTTCRIKYPNYIDNSMLCAGFTAGGIDVCFGDSGGPLSCDEGKTVHGIVSWGDGGCARPETPSVYTQVSYYIDWIEQEMIFP